MDKKIAVLGAGCWGTALAHHLAQHGMQTILWAREAEILAEIASKRENSTAFPKYKLSQEIVIEAELTKAVASSNAIVFAVPSSAMREMAQASRAHLKPNSLLISVAKGLEEQTRLRMSEVLASENLPVNQISVLSGPSFAKEVLQAKPTAVTIAANSLEVAEQAASYFHQGYFRVYTSTDIVGVELGGVFKNILAIAAGVVDGLSIGAGARAALITRGLAEMKRLILCLGGNAETVTGLSGLGDLLLTATGDLSRNRQVGLHLAAGKSLAQALKEIGQVAEGVKAAETVLALGGQHKIALPITEQVVALLQGQTSPQESMEALFARERTTEH